MRVMSVILTFLLIFTMTAGTGMTTVFAKEYKKGSNVHIKDIKRGDILDSNAYVHGSYGGEGYNVFDAYFNGTKYYSNDYEMVLDRRVKVLSVETDPNRSDKLIFRVVDYGDAVEADSEETLNGLLNEVEDVTLSDDIELNRPIIISGKKSRYINTNGHTISLSENGGGSLFILTGGASLTLSDNVGGSKLMNGNNMSDGGGAVHIRNSTLVIQNITLTGNKGKGGGAIFAKSGSVELNNCTITDNYAEKNGGGLFIDENSTANLTNCVIERNQAYDGGGICNSGTLNVSGCKIRFNNVKGGGSGIWSKGEAKLSKTNVDQNYNAINGGGVTNHKNMTISGCTVSNNSAKENGGGMFIDTDGSTVIDSATEIKSNTASDGAGISNQKGKLTITDSSILNNAAKVAGGGIWANNGTELSFKNVKIQGNSCATNGGGLNSHGTVSLTNCSIDSNSADNCGGGVYMDTSSTLTVDNSTITYCQAKGSGGGIYFHAGSLILAGGKIRITDSNMNGRASNLYQREFKKIQVTGRFSNGSDVGFEPPANSANMDVTTGYGENNDVAPALYFHCDTNEYKINKDENLKEVNLVEGLRGTNSSYKIKIDIAVTDDADLWDYAYFYIYGKDNKGKGKEVQINSSPDFKTSIDHNGGSYSYSYDCGADTFPSMVKFTTSFGHLIGRREFEGDVKIYINGTNVVNTHVKHVANGQEEKSSHMYISGDKYPCPDRDGFEVDAPPGDIAESGVVTVSAIDQYGLIWKADGNNTSIKNISFPEEDTAEMLDNTGFKWKLKSTHNTIHFSTYKLIFKTGSNVYPEITKEITVRFIFPQHVRVIVDGKEVFSTVIEKEKQVVQIRNIKSITGYYISGYEKEGTGEILSAGKTDADVDVIPVNQSITLTAILKGNNYKIAYDGNGTMGPNKRYTDIRNTMRKKTAYYGEPYELDKVKYTRDGYTFVGWNTQPDGKGEMFKDMATVKNLTDVKNETVTLYAIWKPKDGSTTASIFSDGTELIYVGSGILILSIIGAVVYSKLKKRKEKQGVEN